MSKLIIVESPTKIKKIKEFLPPGFEIQASVGHVRDLPRNKKDAPKEIQSEPWADLGVNTEDGFKPYYVVIAKKSSVISQMKKELKDATELLLATDEDREGESISWHLLELLKPKGIPVRRMVFNEITKKAILHALENTRELDTNLVQAQETRRILDRLYGYTLSPLLWRKIGGTATSAGRVQSVALRLIVEKERSRMGFQMATYWGVKANLAAPQKLVADLVRLGGIRIAIGSDFDDDTGKIREGLKVHLLEESAAKSLIERLRGRPLEVLDFTETPKQSSPYAPFITSTLQQEASSRLNLNSKDTMSVAQQLYQEGFITYMRTDSPLLSEEAITASRAVIESRFGKQFLHATPRQYGAKKPQGAQEAHEAIRPAGEEFVLPEKSRLSGKQLALYKLIFDRTIASQMVNEEYLSQRLVLRGDEAEFQTGGRNVTNPGYRLAWPLTGEQVKLRSFVAGELVTVESFKADGHETQPPSRYTEAKLIKSLEESRIGRPSTYAAIMDKIQQNYTFLKGKQIVPTFTAMAVIQLLEREFPQLVDYDFTASMEDTLDLIAAGSADATEFLTKFYSGENGLKNTVELKLQDREVDVRGLDFPHLEGIQVRTGRFGPFAETTRNGEKVQVSLPTDVPPADFTAEYLDLLLQTRQNQEEPITNHPETGTPIYLKTGRFGPYVTMTLGDDKPLNKSLPDGVTIDTLTPETAQLLMSLPRSIGVHPDGGELTMDLGRYGPYVCREVDGKKTFASLPNFDAISSFEVADVIPILEKKGAGSRAGATIILTLKEGDTQKDRVEVCSGRYGPYVRFDGINATIPKGEAAETMTLTRAMELIEERRAAAPKAKKGARKAPAKKSPKAGTAKKAAPKRKS